MAKYTVSLEEYTEGTALASYTGDDPMGYLLTLTDTQKHNFARSIFPTTYPFYSDTASVKTEFEDEFIDHFYMEEIGQETIGRFKLALKCFLNERMPYYSELYASRLTNLTEALKDVDLTRTDTGTLGVSGSSSSQGSNTSSGTNSQSDTDKGYVYPLNGSDFEENSKATASSSGTDSSTSSSSASGTNQSTETHNLTHRTYGMSGINKITRTKEFRDLIFSINELIFEDARKAHLFMQLW